MKRWGPALFPAILACSALLLFYHVRSILLPFALAMTMAFLLNPVVRFLEVRGLRRGPVVILLFLSLLSLFVFGVYRGALLAAREADEAAQRMPLYIEKGQDFISRWRASAHRAQIPERRKTVMENSPMLRALFLDPRLIDSVDLHSHQWPRQILSKMPSFASGILPALELAFLVPFIGFFLMWEGPKLRDRVLAWLPSRMVEMSLNVLVELDNSLGRYLRGIVIEAFCMGLLAFLAFRAIGLDYALQVGVIAGVANLVPYMGPVISGVVAVGISLFQNEGILLALKVIAVCVGLRLVDDALLQPIVLRSAVHLHPVIIVFSLMAGAHLYGFWGLLFAVPVACVAKVLLTVLGDWYRAQYGLRPLEPHPELNRIPLI